MSSDDDLDRVVFDESFVRGGVSEDAIRRQARPPQVNRRAANPANAFGNPTGPRDWTPAPGPATRTGWPRRRRSWLVLALLAVAGMGVAIATGRFDANHPSAPGHATLPSPTASAQNTSSVPAVSGMDQVALGGCFDAPAGATITVTTRSCTAKHGYQLVKLERAGGGSSSYPGDTYWNGPVAKRCYQDLLAYTGQPRSAWPDALRSSEFVPRPEGWAAGDRTVYCLAEWTPAAPGSAHRIRPAAHHSAIAPTGTGTLTGQISYRGSGSHSCVGVTTNRGWVPIVSGTSRFGVTVGTVNGVIDPRQSGITSADGRTVLWGGGTRVTLTGTYAPPVAGNACGAPSVFALTAARSG